MSRSLKIKSTLFLIAVLMFCNYTSTNAADIYSLETFYVDNNYDELSRDKIEARLIKESPRLHFYAEKSWWDGRVQSSKEEVLNNLHELSVEFESKIYPILTSIFGSEPNPGVDNSEKITILFHPMKDGPAGYFRSTDGYYKVQVPNSNEREMVYLSTADIKAASLKSSLAHEFVHLITFNQKDKLRSIQEEVWLNEARAEYAGAILGYDSIYEGSVLQRRVRDFLANPSVSLTELKNTKYNYASLKLFIYYLVDHYGINILSDSLKSNSFGIESINKALLVNGFKEDFAQIFTDWTIANIINNCSIGKKYCYLNKNLVDLKINPPINFLPLSGDSSLSVKNSSKNWMPNWQKIIGGNGSMTLTFSGASLLNYKVPYILFGKNGISSVDFMILNESQSGQIEMKDFSISYDSLVLIPSLQSKMMGFGEQEPSYPYTFTVSFGSGGQEDNTLIQQLLSQIESLKKQILALQLGNTPNSSCTSITSNLYLGVARSDEVKCLQQFLKEQGPSIYPEGFVTGYFGNLTKSAVIRFQQKYSIPATGFVGILTKTKINQLLDG